MSHQYASFKYQFDLPLIDDCAILIFNLKIHHLGYILNFDLLKIQKTIILDSSGIKGVGASDGPLLLTPKKIPGKTNHDVS